MIVCNDKDLDLRFRKLRDYGKKSQCVINIVPKSKKCKSFKIDKRCIIKKRSGENKQSKI